MLEEKYLKEITQKELTGYKKKLEKEISTYVSKLNNQSKKAVKFYNQSNWEGLDLHCDDIQEILRNIQTNCEELTEE